MGCSRKKQGQARQYHTPAEQFFLGREHAPSSCRQPTGGPPVPCHHILEPAASNPFFSQSCEKRVPGTLYKSKYLCSQGLPSPALYFLPLLKMPQISCFHNCAGNELPAGWQLNTRLCWVCCGCTAHLCCQLLHPPSILRGWICPEGTRHRVRDMGTEERDYGSLSSLHSSEEPLFPGPQVQSGSWESQHCLCHFRANIQTRLTQLPACMQGERTQEIQAYFKLATFSLFFVQSLVH